MAMMPASVMTIATTMASRGRSMKMPENISRCRHEARRHKLPGAHLLDAFDDDQFPFFEAAGHNDVAIALGASRDPALLDLLFRVDHEDITAGLIEEYGGLRNQQRRLRLTALHGNADNSAWDQEMFRVRHLRPYRHGVGRGVDLDVEEIVDAGMRIQSAIGQLDANSHLPVLVPRFEDLALVVEHVALACLKQDINRILADDRRKLSRGRLDQVALCEEG